MNRRLLTVPAMSGGRIFGALAAATLIVSTSAYGQQPVAPAAPKAAAKAAPAAQAPPAAQPPQTRQPPIEQQVRLIYSPWTRYCAKGQGANAKQICFIGKDGRTEAGQVVIAAVIVEPEGEPRRILRVTVPLRVQLAHGTRVIIDNNTPAQSPYVICLSNGCVADYEATPEMIADLKKGQDLYVQAIDESGATLTLPLPLQEANGGFAKSFDSPPTDPKVFEENYKKLEEDLQKRANEARQRLEAAQQPPTAAMTPNPTEK
jgi:invasion protein IalB